MRVIRKKSAKKKPTNLKSLVPTYVYETVPRRASDKPTRFEYWQWMKDALNGASSNRSTRTPGHFGRDFSLTQRRIFWKQQLLLDSYRVLLRISSRIQ